MVLSPLYFKSHKKGIILVSCLLLALLISIPVNTFLNVQNSNQPISFGMKGQLEIKIDGQVVYNQPDLIMPTFYAFNYCKMFNDTTPNGACMTTDAWFGDEGTYYPVTNGCTTYSTTGTDDPDYFTASSRCIATAVVLSTDTDTPSVTNNYMNTILHANGFSPVQGTISTLVFGSNTITLSAIWTATANQAGIDKVGITVWNTKANAFVDTTDSNTHSETILTSDLFTSQSVNSGQTFQVIYTISM